MDNPHEICIKFTEKLLKITKQSDMMILSNQIKHTTELFESKSINQ